MELLRKLAVVASGAVAVAGMGVVYAGAASASSTPQILCVSGEVACAQAPSANGDSILMETSNDTSEWYYPSPGSRTIRHNGTDGCMQAQSDGHVILEDCTTNSDQEWSVYASENGWSMFENGAYPGKCLEWASTAETLITDTCDTSTAGQHLYPGEQ
jgi:hypothetical protein